MATKSFSRSVLRSLTQWFSMSAHSRRPLSYPRFSANSLTRASFACIAKSNPYHQMPEMVRAVATQAKHNRCFSGSGMFFLTLRSRTKNVICPYNVQVAETDCKKNGNPRKLPDETETQASRFPPGNQVTERGSGSVRASCYSRRAQHAVRVDSLHAAQGRAGVTRCQMIGGAA